MVGHESTQQERPTSVTPADARTFSDFRDEEWTERYARYLGKTPGEIREMSDEEISDWLRHNPIVEGDTHEEQCETIARTFWESQHWYIAPQARRATSARTGRRPRFRSREHRPAARRRSASSSTTSSADPPDEGEPPAALRRRYTIDENYLVVEVVAA